MANTVCIALCTYNGERFLDEQLKSIAEQSSDEWLVAVRDDGSSDSTIEILASYASADARFHIEVDELGNLGAKENFRHLLSVCFQKGYNYIALSDHDDVWHSQKLERQMEKMLAMEAQYPGMPILVHSDLEVVDDRLDSIATSFMKYQYIRHENALKVLLAQNFVPGCTVVINRSLLEIALPIPKEALMHDWWLALCAAACGRIEYIDKPLVKYRQHGSNEVGVKSIKSFLNEFRTNWCKGRKHLFRSIAQARVLAERIKEHDSENKNLKLIESYALLTTLPWWQRTRQLKKNHIHCQSRLRHYLMLSRLLSLPRANR